jgi:hypothetical protein
MEAARAMGGHISEDAAVAIIDEAAAVVRHRRADRLGIWLRLTYADRMRLRIRTIGAIDVDKQERRERRKRAKRLDNERRRRAQGKRPHSESLTKRKPWADLGIGRATWYRQRETKKRTILLESHVRLSVSPLKRFPPSSVPSSTVLPRTAATQPVTMLAVQESVAEAEKLQRKEQSQCRMTK